MEFAVIVRIGKLEEVEKKVLMERNDWGLDFFAKK